MTTDIAKIVAHFGPTVSRKALEAFCLQHKMNMPGELLKHKTGARGVYDISMFQKVTASENEPAPEVRAERTQEEIQESVRERFESLDMIAAGVIKGLFRACVVSGNAGIGKTYGLRYMLDTAADENRIKVDYINGFVRATGIYKILYENREEGNVIVFDDCDSVFQDEIGLNLLKGALDTSKKRIISWRAETKMELGDGERLPDNFEYRGSCVFVTNLDFDLEIARLNRNTPHLKALMSRSMYTNLNLDDQELTERIAQVVQDTDMMFVQGVDDSGTETILDYFFDTAHLFREKSLRTIIKLANIYKAADDPKSFYKMANATCLDPRKVKINGMPKLTE
jgi:hypothetical protein